MKLLIAFCFLFSLNSFAETQFDETQKDYNSSIDSMSEFRIRMDKCGYFIPNKDRFKLKLKTDKDTVKRDCLLSKTTEIDSESSAESQRETRRNGARARIKALDCLSLSGFQKDVCIIIKGR